MAFSFGQSQPASSTFGSTATPFGAASNPAASPFGQPSNTPVFGQPVSSFGQSASSFGQSTSSIFGAPQSQSSFGQSTSLFGGSQSQSGFGTPANQSGPSLFGGQSQSAFGGQSASSFGMGTPANPGSNPSNAAAPTRLPDELTDLVDRQMNTNHPDCRFQTALYHRVDPAAAASYARPAGMQERTWKNATTNNPDPSRLVPVSINWFGDLVTRVQVQNQQLEGHKTVLELVKNRLEKISVSVDTEIEPRLAVLRRRHRDLARRLLNVAVVVETAAAREDSAGNLNQGERNRFRRLEVLHSDISAPGHFKDKLFDLAELAKCISLDARNGAGAAVLKDASAANAVKAVLTEQLEGIQKLHEVCETTVRNVGIVEEGLRQM